MLSSCSPSCYGLCKQAEKGKLCFELGLIQPTHPNDSKPVQLTFTWLQLLPQQVPVLKHQKKDAFPQKCKTRASHQMAAGGFDPTKLFIPTI